jgi:glycosyltransferase involved in cell wall biosynthesis
LYGSTVARLLGQPHVVNTLAGLGYMFGGHGLVARLRRAATLLAYRVAWAAPGLRAIFENADDRALFVDAGILDGERATVVAGTGIDPERYTFTPEQDGEPVVLLASRLLWEKGVGEFVAAAERLKARGVAARFLIAGAPDEFNPGSVSRDDLERWVRQGTVEWIGLRNDMPAVIGGCHLLVLPSYYPEGVPRILIEAASMGRAIVTTDTPGCRDVVRHGENGVLVPPRDVDALADAIAGLLANPERRRAMGAAGRRRVLAEFAEDLVVKRYLDVYRSLLGSDWPVELATPKPA